MAARPLGADQTGQRQHLDRLQVQRAEVVALVLHLKILSITHNLVDLAAVAAHLRKGSARAQMERPDKATRVAETADSRVAHFRQAAVAVQVQ